MPDASNTFASPSKRPLRDGTRLTPRPPLLGFVLVCASLSTCLRPSTPGSATEAALPSDTGCHTGASRSALGVSHPLDGFLRSQGPGLLHPGAECEVRRVSVTTACHDPEAAQHGQVTFPSTRSHPSKTRSSPTAVPHHCGRCLRAVHRGRTSDDARPSTTSVPSRRRCRGTDHAWGHRLHAALWSHHRSRNTSDAAAGSRVDTARAMPGWAHDDAPRAGASPDRVSVTAGPTASRWPRPGAAVDSPVASEEARPRSPRAPSRWRSMLPRGRPTDSEEPPTVPRWRLDLCRLSPVAIRG